MAGFELKNFRGLNISRDERLLDINEATEAQGLLFDGSGTLRGWDSPWQLRHSFGAIADPRTIFYHEKSVSPAWLQWPISVEVAKGPVAGDTLNRIYVTGDGAPKMTYEGLSPTFRPLGVPAPASAPTVSTSTPTTTLAGAIEELTCSNLKMIHEVRGREGRNSGSGATTVNATTTPVSLTTLPVGSRVKVASIVDVDHVTITGVGDINYSVAVDKLNYGLEWGAPSNDQLWRKRKKAYWNFLVPSGATLKITSHGLEVGDVIQITATTNVMSWDFAQLNTTPISDQSARTATKSAGGNITFTGSCNFIVDRGGQTIDPLVPSQNYDVQLRGYAYTYVTGIGEESAPSPISDVISVYTGNSVTVSGFAAAPSGYDIGYLRIYRSNTGTDGTELQFVAEVTLPAASYVDSTPDEELGEVLPPVRWLMPESTMRNIVTMPNGMMAACIPEKKLVVFCEPGYPHAWPEEYQYPIEHEPVSLAVFGNSLFVGTKGNPYVFVGTHPRQMAWQRIPVVEPCIGRQSATTIGDRVAYVSPNGVIAVNESSAVNITATQIPPDIWREYLTTDLAGHNIRGFWYENQLEFVQITDATESAGIVSLAFNADAMDVSLTTRANYTGYVIPATGKLFRAVDGGVAFNVHELMTSLRQDEVVLGPTFFDGTGTAFWRSKRITFDRPINMAWANVKFEYSGFNSTKQWADVSLTVSFISRLSNGTEQTFTKACVAFVAPDTQQLLFRLPAGYLAESMVVRVSLSEYVRVKSIAVGETVEDVL